MDHLHLHNDRRVRLKSLGGGLVGPVVRRDETNSDGSVTLRAPLPYGVHVLEVQFIVCCQPCVRQWRRMGGTPTMWSPTVTVALERRDFGPDAYAAEAARVEALRKRVAELLGG